MEVGEDLFEFAEERRLRIGWHVACGRLFKTGGLNFKTLITGGLNFKTLMKLRMPA